MNKGHYQIAGFECSICFKEIRVNYLLDTPERPIVCKEHTQGQIVVLRNCQHCHKRGGDIGIVAWKDYPLEERAIPFHTHSQEMGTEEIPFLMETYSSQAWCETCINQLLNQMVDGKVKVFDAITMDKDE